MNQRTTFRRLAVILSLLFTCAGLAILAPGRAQEGTPGDLYTIVVPAGDSMALALAIINQPPTPVADTPATHIYLQGGVYTFSFPGSTSQPQFPLMAGRMVIHGNQATIRLENYAPDMVITVDVGAEVTFKQVTIQFESPQGRSILNRGKLSLIDSVLSNDAGSPAYTQGEGGGIHNEGELNLERVTLRGLRMLSSSEPGGAITNSGTLEAQCVHFAHNRASQGGAVYNAPGGSAQIRYSVFEGNRANGGGAIYNADEAEVNASENWWGQGGIPSVNDSTLGWDTISSGVGVVPVASANPFETRPECVPAAPVTLPSAGGYFQPLSVAIPPNLSRPLAYQNSSTTLQTIFPAGGVESENWSEAALIGMPAWSADGHWVVFASYQSGNADIWVRDLHTGVSSNLTHNPYAQEQDPLWSPDGERLVFNAQTSQENLIGIMGAAGDNYHTLNPGLGGRLLPSWSYDGQHIVFNANGGVFRVAAALDSAPEFILSYALLADDFRIRYISGAMSSPVDERIVFSAQYHDPLEAYLGRRLFSINPDGSNLQQITWGADFIDQALPVWSPLGSEIAFLGKGFTGSYSLFVVSADGTGTPFQIDTVHNSPRPSWRPGAQMQATPTPTLTSVCSNITLTGPKNIRSAPNSLSPIVRTILEGGQLAVDFIGYHRVSEAEKWYRVRFEGTQYGWLSGTLFYSDPCPGLPELDALGNPPPATSTPTPTATLLYTLTPTSTPTFLPTLHPHPTLFPLTLCQGESAAWRKNLCQQGVRHLNPSEAQLLSDNIQAQPLFVSANYQQTDEWWLANMGRGVGDIPPESGWGNFDPAQCYGDAFCLQYGRAIVDNAVFLFRNMKYIGVDLPAIGTGDDTPEWLTLGITTIPPNTAIDPQFACGQNRFGGLALVCWVCQDLPTLIYKQAGFDLEARLKGYPSIRDSFNAAALARNNIPSAIVLRDIQHDIQAGNISASTPYRIGEMVFLTASSSDFININQNTDNAPYHVLLVVQGGIGLEQVLLAQVSYSAAGFFTSREGVKGRFEVITLRNLLYRLASETSNILTDSQLNQIAATHIVRGIVR